MKELTFAIWVVIGPVYFAYLGSTFAYAAFGRASGLSLLAFVAALILLALTGYERQKNFWLWARHHLVVGHGSDRLTRELLLLFGISGGAWLFFFWLFAPAGGGAAFFLSATVSGLIFCFAPISFAKPYNPLVRGTNLLTLDDAKKLSALKLPPGDPGITFGGLPLQSIVSVMHFLIIGAVGAAKTKLMEGLFKRFLPTLKTMDARAVILDPKAEFLRYIDSLGLDLKVVILDCTDARCWAWIMGKDLRDEDDAIAASEIMVPINDKASQPFFENATREILKEIMVVLMRRLPGRWTLRHIRHFTRSIKSIKAILCTTAEGREIYQNYFSKHKTAQDIMSEIATRIGRFNTVAKAWDKAEREGRTVSIDEWLKGNFIILLGNANKAEATLRDLNHLFFKRLSQCLLDEPDIDQRNLLSPKSRRHYLLLDEVRAAHKLDGLHELFVRGRSKGCVIAVSVQDRKGMLAVYGEHIADEQLSQAATIAVLRLQNPDTADWCAKLIGQAEFVSVNHSTGADGKCSETASLNVKNAVLASEILRLPLSGPERGVNGFFISPSIGVWRAAIPWSEIMEARMPVRESTMENYVKMVSDPNEPLRPWDEKELFELGISCTDLEGEKEVEGPDEEEEEDDEEDLPTPEEEEEALERLSRIHYDDDLMN